MKMKGVFCEECRKMVVPNISEEKLSGTIKGDEYFYIGKIVRCGDCKNELYVPEINDFNLEMLYKEYREKNDIVSLDIVRKLPKKYAIGKRPLSLLLGWGEQTFTRYYEGDIPTKQYSDIIKRIYNEPSYYAEILENNKENMKSDTAYWKSLKAVNDIIGKPKQQTKINLAVDYLVNQCEDITPLALQKALYYIQGFYYAFYNSFIFEEDCEAWVHGPVYREIYERYQNYHFNVIDEKSDFDSTVFSMPEKTIFDSIIKNICCYSGKILEKFTHSERPWLITRGDTPAYALSDKIIEKKYIGDYFCDVKNKYNMINPNDIEAYTKNMFESI